MIARPKFERLFGVDKEVLGKIERGGKVTLDQETLIRIADAFGLTSAERRQFFLASMYVESRNIPATTATAAEVVGQIMSYLEGCRLPFYFSDNFCDVICANEMIIRLLNMRKAIDLSKTEPAGYNVAKLVFDPQYGYKALMGNDWHNHAIYNIRYFRVRTLTSRHEAYFDELLDYLNSSKVPEFRHYWEQLQFRDEYIFGNDYASGHITYDYMHPELGRMRYLATETITVTSAGTISTIMYVPRDSFTAEQFEKKLAPRGGTMIRSLSPFPVENKGEFRKLLK